MNLIDPLGLESCTVNTTDFCITVNEPFLPEPGAGGGDPSAGTPLIFKGGKGGGGGSVLGRAAKNLAKKKLNKKKCLKDLKALGTTPADVQAGAKAANFINGVGSTVPLASLYPSTLSPYVSGTVGGALAKPGTVAVASLVGHDIYYNPANINANDYYFELGTAFHEVLHNITGDTDPDLQKALGIKQQDITSNITDKLIKDCL